MAPRSPSAKRTSSIANAFAWPSLIGRIVVSALIVGFPIALTVAWYHGHRALRRISVGELSILSALVLIGALFFTVALRRDEGAAAPAAQALNATAAPAPAPSPNGTSAGGEVLPNKVAVLPCEDQSPIPTTPILRPACTKTSSGNSTSSGI